MKSEGGVDSEEIINPAQQRINEMGDQIRAVGGPTLADFLSSPEAKEVFKYKKIVVAGPPRSGKSCFNKGIKDTIQSIPNAPYPFVHTACPDGEGSWFQETMNANPVLAAKLKADYKSKFTPEFVQMQSKAVKNLGNDSCPLNFIDIGGMTTAENAKICEGANAAIILSGETAIAAGLPAEWKKFFDGLGIPVIAEVYSDYNGNEDIVRGVAEDGVFRGSVHHLERGEVLSNRPTLKELANHVINFEKRDYKVEAITKRVDQLIEKWQGELPDVQIVLGGSLVSGLFIFDEQTDSVDVDLRFLVPATPSTEDAVTQELIKKIEKVTGLKYRKTISVADWPEGTSAGIQIEGEITIDGVELPLDVEGCLRNDKYVGWARYYKDVLSPKEFAQFKSDKIRLRDDKEAYKALKQEVIAEVKKRCLERGFVKIVSETSPSEEQAISSRWSFDGKKLLVDLPEGKLPIADVLDYTVTQFDLLEKEGAFIDNKEILVDGPVTVTSAALLAEKLSHLSNNISFSDNEGRFVSLFGNSLLEEGVNQEIQETKMRIEIEQVDDVFKVNIPFDGPKHITSRAFIERLRDFIKLRGDQVEDILKINGRLTTPAAAAAGMYLSKYYKVVAIFYPQLKKEDEGYVVIKSDEPNIVIGSIIK